MQRRTMKRVGVMLGGLAVVLGLGAFAGHWLASDMARTEAFRSLPPNHKGIAWVACHSTVEARSSSEAASHPRAFCQHVAEDVCHGPATYLDHGGHAREANRFRERFRCGPSLRDGLDGSLDRATAGT